MPQAPQRSELLHGGFTAVPNIVLLRTDIGGMAKTLYALILDIVQFQKRQPTVEELSVFLGAGERVVRNATLELVNANLIEVRRRGLGMTNAYTLLEPPPLILQNEDH